MPLSVEERNEARKARNEKKQEEKKVEREIYKKARAKVTYKKKNDKAVARTVYRDKKSGKWCKKDGTLGTVSKPKNQEVRAYIRSISNDLQDYINMLDKISRDSKKPLGDRITCIRELLNRAAGKPGLSSPQTGAINISIGLPAPEQKMKLATATVVDIPQLTVNTEESAE